MDTQARFLLRKLFEELNDDRKALEEMGIVLEKSETYLNLEQFAKPRKLSADNPVGSQCIRENCDKKVVARGLCAAHFKALRRSLQEAGEGK